MWRHARPLLTLALCRVACVCRPLASITSADTSLQIRSSHLIEQAWQQCQRVVMPGAMRPLGFQVAARWPQGQSWAARMLEASHYIVFWFVIPIALCIAQGSSDGGCSPALLCAGQP